MIRAVLWDNDGVLVDTELAFFEVTRAAFARLGLTLTKEVWGSQYLGQGRTSREIATSLGGDPSRIPAVLEERNQQFRQVLLAKPAPVRPQVREVLARLAGRVDLAMVTGCDREQLELVHRTTGLLKFFRIIVTSSDCAHAKPHPEPYLAALGALGVAPGDCVAIEDTPRGLAAACAAGISCVVVPTELTSFLKFPGALGVEPEVSGVWRYLAPGLADSPPARD